MKIYLAGPMKGIPDHNYPAFHEAAKRLRDYGLEVVSPAEWATDKSRSWDFYMRVNIPLLCECDGIALLPGWQQSEGATLERHIARKLGMPALYLEEF